MSDFHHISAEPEKTRGIDSEYFAGRRFPYQESLEASAMGSAAGGFIPVLSHATTARSPARRPSW